jgi:type I restriction enzyme R subunit
VVIFTNLPDILAAGRSLVVGEEKPASLEEIDRLAKLALEIDEAMREEAQAGWKGDETKERLVQNFLYRIMNKNREATAALFDLVKNQSGY